MSNTTNTTNKNTNKAVNKATSKTKKSINSIINFLKNDVWNIETENMNIFYRGLIYIYKILVLTINDFLKNKCMLWAASITYSTLLSSIPIIAVMLFIARVFSLYEYIFSGILSIVHQFAPEYEPFIRQIFSFIQNTELSNYGLVGLIATVASMILLLMNIQKCLMSIWNIKRTASLPRLVADYIALIMLLPILIGVAFALVAYSQFAIHLLPTFIRFILSTVAPIFSLWFIILLFYVLIPPTKVLWRGAVVSSLITATIIIIMVNFYFKYNIGVDKYKVVFDNQLNYTEYKIEAIKNIGLLDDTDLTIDDVKIIADTEMNDANREAQTNTSTTTANASSVANSSQAESSSTNSGNTNNNNSNNDRMPSDNRQPSTTTVEPTAPSITILATDYTRVSDSNNKTTIDGEATVTSSRSMTFNSISDSALEQIIQYDFKVGDIVVITYGNKTLLSIIPQSFSLSGAFVQIPVLLVLIYICYIIVLFGAELNHSYQSMRLYSKDISNYSLSFDEREAIAFSMISDIAMVFLNKEKQISLNGLAEKYKIPPEVVSSLLSYFETEGYIISFASTKGVKYALAASPEEMKMADLVKGFRTYGSSGRDKDMKNDYYFRVIEAQNEVLNEDKFEDSTLMEHLSKYSKG